MDLSKDYKKFRWFFTSSNTLVIGGKSAEQNDLLLKFLKSQNKDYFVMHTKSPGSPFSVILEDPEKLNKSDLEECISFTASFSRAWKLGKKKETVDIFKLSQLFKSNSMNQGTWGINGSILSQKEAELKLVLTKQKGVLRAVPPSSVEKKETILTILPGKVDKLKILPELAKRLSNKFKNDEILSALPTGGINIK